MLTILSPGVTHTWQHTCNIFEAFLWGVGRLPMIATVVENMWRLNFTKNIVALDGIQSYVYLYAISATAEDNVYHKNILLYIYGLYNDLLRMYSIASTGWMIGE
jgi:hypothetical protein